VEPEPAAARADGDDASPDCPKCGGRMWDNRLTKRNPKAPDHKCRDRSCDGVVWPARGAEPAARPASDTPAEPAAAPASKRSGARTRETAPAGRAEPALDASPLVGGAGDDDDLPF
jgi:hypothetical protein